MASFWSKLQNILFGGVNRGLAVVRLADDPHDFYLFDEDWGVVEIVSAENKEQRLRDLRAHHKHHKDTVFSPVGWTAPPFVIEGAEVPLAASAIPFDRFIESFSKSVGKVAVSETFSGRALLRRDAFACKLDDDDDVYLLYGSVENGIVSDLNLQAVRLRQSTNVERWTDVLNQIGIAHNLILVDWNWEALVDLRDRKDLSRYLRSRVAGDWLK